MPVIDLSASDPPRRVTRKRPRFTESEDEDDDGIVFTGAQAPPTAVAGPSSNTRAASASASSTRRRRTRSADSFELQLPNRPALTLVDLTTDNPVVPRQGPVIVRGTARDMLSDTSDEEEDDDSLTYAALGETSAPIGQSRWNTMWQSLSSSFLESFCEAELFEDTINRVGSTISRLGTQPPAPAPANNLTLNDGPPLAGPSARRVNFSLPATRNGAIAGRGGRAMYFGGAPFHFQLTGGHTFGGFEAYMDALAAGPDLAHQKKPKYSVAKSHPRKLQPGFRRDVVPPDEVLMVEDDESPSSDDFEEVPQCASCDKELFISSEAGTDAARPYALRCGHIICAECAAEIKTAATTSRATRGRGKKAKVVQPRVVKESTLTWSKCPVKDCDGGNTIFKGAKGKLGTETGMWEVFMV